MRDESSQTMQHETSPETVTADDQDGLERARAVVACQKPTCEDHGCICESSVAVTLRCAGLRPTRQRLSLGALMFDGKDRHVTAEWLHEQAREAGVTVSLATVYNTLHQFVDVGLLREVAIEGSKNYFDTNTSDHHHFFVEGESRLMDMNSSSLSVNGIPDVPDGYEVTHIDVVVRLRPTKN